MRESARLFSEPNVLYGVDSSDETVLDQTREDVCRNEGHSSFEKRLLK
jgi:hypothetical protein